MHAHVIGKNLLCTEPRALPRFHFEAFWPSVQGFAEVVAGAWTCPPGLDACRTIDYKLRNVAKALKAWSAQRIGNVRFQLAAARVIIFELDVAQETRQLSPEELDLRRDLKEATLGLSSLSKTITRQRSRHRYLKDGDVNTKFFHLKACHRKQKNYIPMLVHEGHTFTYEEATSEAVFDYYNALLGTHFRRSHRIDLERLSLPRLDLQALAKPFSEADVTRIILESPPDRAPSSDRFTDRFY